MKNFVPKAIFNLLYMNPEGMTGYDITVFLAPRTGHSHQQIYRELNKLKEDGKLRYTHVPQEGKPDKKVYQLVDRTNVATNLAIPAPDKRPFGRTDAAYQLLLHDILYKTNMHAVYVRRLEEMEEKLLTEWGYSDGSN